MAVRLQQRRLLAGMSSQRSSARHLHSFTRQLAGSGTNQHLCELIVACRWSAPAAGRWRQARSRPHRLLVRQLRFSRAWCR